MLRSLFDKTSGGELKISEKMSPFKDESRTEQAQNVSERNLF